MSYAEDGAVVPDQREQRDQPHLAPSLVVGLGASAGGVRVLQQFFRHPEVAEIGAAYVAVLHLSPEHESRLAEVLAAVTSIPVTRVTETVRVERDHVYVISPNTSLRMADGLLTVSANLRGEERRAPVDIFFRTLGDTHGPRAVCIVLSGTGPDGSNGIKRIKEQGGIVIAQDPAECEHADMPRNAIATGFVDHVLPVNEMPPRLLALVRQLGPLSHEETPPVLEGTPEPLHEILTLVRLRTGHDFSHYKTATVLRRIERRRLLHDLPDLPAYARFVREQAQEVQALQRELLVSVTHFFRDPDAFAALRRTVIPRLFHSRPWHDQVRVWVAGCATGEEAYSMAIILAEAVDRLSDSPTAQVFATDLDERAIGEAREGFYTDADVADVSPERLHRFFTRASGGYRVRRELRETVLFAHHNVLKDPPFSHLDLVCCRNLLIYLNRIAQERLIHTFHFALKPGGYLFLGTSESPDGNGELFATLDKTAHIYEGRLLLTRPEPPVAVTDAAAGRTLVRPPERPPPRVSDRISSGDLHLRLLEQLAAPSIVVSEEHQIVHLSEHAGEYLQVGGGELSRDLLRLVRPELRLDLRTALHRAARERVDVEVRGLEVTIDGQQRRVDIAVRPVLRPEDAARGFLLVLFSLAEPAGRPSAAQVVSPRDGDAARQLEEEAIALKAQLRATIDQYETQVEEAKASNEELLAVNEELRSAAQELETSKEELQSVNEELATVNQELQIKIDELALTNDNFQNLINSTEIGTIFLDRSLRVKFSTPRARDVFNLLPLDIGRPLSDISSNLRYEGLADDAVRVLERLQTIERELETKQGRWYLVRVLPYRTREERIEGIVITFQDVTDRRQAESRVRASEERLRLLLDSLKDFAIFTITPAGRIDSWNTAAQRMFGYPEREFVGLPVEALYTPEDRARGIPEQELQRAVTDGRAEDERWCLRKDGTLLFCSGVVTPLGGAERRGYVKVARDLTATRDSELALKRARADLEERIRQTQDLEIQLEQRSGGERRVTALLRQLVTAQEEDRARIARNIHDVVGQQLIALRLALERYEARTAAPVNDTDFVQALRIVQDIDKQLDFLAWELRPAALDDLGLAVALSRYVQSWSTHHGVEAEFRAAGLEGERLATETETVFYRITQEALNNVAKHAHASRVDVIVERRDGHVVLVVEDNGVGFGGAEKEAGATGMGLAGMRERATLIGATFQIESSPGEGTTIFVRTDAVGQAADA
ncbi:MAG TPA: CheR family methyltransferase [Vicinamibacterales bacterium]|nr:CheR family methyltransferase [Vicinamibacterales bacterium]